MLKQGFLIVSPICPLALQVRREMLAQACNAIIIPPLTAFDGNVITPGTPFMARLAAHLRQLIEHKVGSDPDWRHLQVIIASPASVDQNVESLLFMSSALHGTPDFYPNSCCIMGLTKTDPHPIMIYIDNTTHVIKCHNCRHHGLCGISPCMLFKAYFEAH